MRQESQRIIGWKQRETDHISEDDQHKEVVQVSLFLLHYQYRLMHQQTIQDLPDYFPRAFQLRGEKRKQFFPQMDPSFSIDNPFL